MLVELRLLKRQDLISVMHDTFAPASNDRVHITVYMEREEMDSFVFAIAKKRAASRLLKDFSDIVSKPVVLFLYPVSSSKKNEIFSQLKFKFRT